MLETPASQSHAQSEAQYVRYACQHEVPTIICPICDAVYAPALVQVSFLQAAPGMLESAFMSMCHFCFRCRRPACPQCWDSVHGVCGDCVGEANLAFRSEAAPLDGMLFRPLQRQKQSQQEVAAALLACVKPGRFLQDGALARTAPDETVSATNGRIAAHLSDVRESGPVEDVQERVLTVLALVLLLAIIALVIAAQTSHTANSAILHVLHIDIRAKVAYLIHLVQQLRQ